MNNDKTLESENREFARRLFQTMLCRHGHAHVDAMLRSVACGATKPPTIFNLGDEDFIAIGRRELAGYRNQLISPTPKPKDTQCQRNPVR